MAHDASYKDDAFTAEEAGRLLLQKMLGAEVDPKECLDLVAEDKAARQEHERELELIIPSDDTDD